MDTKKGQQKLINKLIEKNVFNYKLYIFDLKISQFLVPVLISANIAHCSFRNAAVPVIIALFHRIAIVEP